MRDYRDEISITLKEHRRIISEHYEMAEFLGKIYMAAAFLIGVIGGYLSCLMTSQ